MNNPNQDDGHVKDSKDVQAQDDNGKDSTNAQAEEVADAASQAQDAANALPSHASAPSPPQSPPPSSPPSPPSSRTLMRVPTSASQAAPSRPPPLMPFGPFTVPAGPVPPFYNQAMMMPPPPQIPFAPYGLPLMPYGYAMIPYPNPWATGPFDCFSDAKNCCLTFSCPCVTFGQIAEILNEGQTPWWEHAVVYLVLDCITFSLGTFLYAWPYRVKMRNKYWLRGKLLWDFAFTFCCTKVSLCQQYRQLTRLGFDVPLGWEANREWMRLKALENMYQIQHRQVTPPTIEQGMYR